MKKFKQEQAEMIVEGIKNDIRERDIVIDGMMKLYISRLQELQLSGEQKNIFREMIKEINGTLQYSDMEIIPKLEIFYSTFMLVLQQNSMLSEQIKILNYGVKKEGD